MIQPAGVILDAEIRIWSAFPLGLNVLSENDPGELLKILTSDMNIVKEECIRHKCDDCDKEFKKISSLNFHVDVEHGGRIFCCNLCKFWSKSPKGISYHKNSIHRKIYWKCDNCDYKGKLKSHVEQHIKSFHEGECHECHQCNKKFTSKSNLNGHIKRIHEQIKFICDKCRFRAASKSYLEIHKQSLHEGKTYGCAQCTYKTNFKTSLRDHEKIEHEGRKREKTYSCCKCTYQTNLKIRLTSHEEIYHEGKSFPSNLKLVKKVKNELRFKSEKSRMQRKNMVFDSTKLFGCSFCSFWTKRIDNFKRHIKVKHSKSNEYFENNKEDNIPNQVINIDKEESFNQIKKENMKR